MLIVIWGLLPLAAEHATLDWLEPLGSPECVSYPQNRDPLLSAGFQRGPLFVPVWTDVKDESWNDGQNRIVSLHGYFSIFLTWWLKD